MDVPYETFTLLRYDDGSGPRLKVDLGHQTSGDKPGSKVETVRIEGIGPSTTVHASDIDQLIAGLIAARQHIELHAYEETPDA